MDIKVIKKLVLNDKQICVAQWIHKSKCWYVQSLEAISEEHLKNATSIKLINKKHEYFLNLYMKNHSRRDISWKCSEKADLWHCRDFMEEYNPTYIYEFNTEIKNTDVFNQEGFNHLEWIYNRMIKIHNEKKDIDYMLKFKSIIDNTKYKKCLFKKNKFIKPEFECEIFFSQEIEGWGIITFGKINDRLVGWEEKGQCRDIIGDEVEEWLAWDKYNLEVFGEPKWYESEDNFPELITDNTGRVKMAIGFDKKSQRFLFKNDSYSGISNGWRKLNEKETISLVKK